MSERDPRKKLFIPLTGEFFDKFVTGEKREELRLYGPRWNENTCTVGRGVTLSRGYGKGHRLTGNIWKFKRQWGETFGSTYRESIGRIFGTTAVWIACISITDLRPAPLCDVYHSVMHSHPVRCRLPLDHQQEQHEAVSDGKVLRWP